MATTLCEKCFKEWDDHEVYSMVPLTPCNQCGSTDERKNGGLKCHLFPGDPRKLKMKPAEMKGTISKEARIILNDPKAADELFTYLSSSPEEKLKGKEIKIGKHSFEVISGSMITHVMRKS